MTLLGVSFVSGVVGLMTWFMVRNPYDRLRRTLAAGGGVSADEHRPAWDDALERAYHHAMSWAERGWDDSPVFRSRSYRMLRSVLLVGSVLAILLSLLAHSLAPARGLPPIADGGLAVLAASTWVAAATVLAMTSRAQGSREAGRRRL